MPANSVAVWKFRHRFKVLLAGTVGALVVAGTAFAARPFGQPSDPAVVVTDAGAVRGTVTERERSFLGIPYAAPPVGSLRWAAPQPATPWRNVRAATSFGSQCVQPPSPTGPGSTNEDCLYLNVMTPPASRSRHLPVLFWVHGGGFTTGTGQIFDAQRLLAGGDAILVTINYRLGALGFLAHQALDVAGAPVGAFGLADQQAAMRWVQRNIRAFGGDPANVTLLGQSAGAGSVCAHLASPSAAGLFRQAVIQSGPCAGRSTMLSVEQAKTEGARYAAQLGCSESATSAACLRSLPVEALLGGTDPQVRVAFGPAYGGALLPVRPDLAISSGTFNKVPVIQGVNHDEQRLFVMEQELSSGRPPSEADYNAAVENNFPGAAAQVKAEYPLSAYPSPAIAIATLLTDATWSCPALDTSRTLSRYVPTFAYEFDDENAPTFIGIPPVSFPLGAFHGAELQYLFISPALPDLLNDSQSQLSRQMVQYWLRFAKTGDPNSRHAPAWPSFHAGHQYVQSLAPGQGQIRRVDFAAEHHCGFWDGLTTQH